MGLRRSEGEDLDRQGKENSVRAVDDDDEVERRKGAERAGRRCSEAGSESEKEQARLGSMGIGTPHLPQGWPARPWGLSSLGSLAHREAAFFINRGSLPALRAFLPLPPPPAFLFLAAPPGPRFFLTPPGPSLSPSHCVVTGPCLCVTKLPHYLIELAQPLGVTFGVYISRSDCTGSL